MRFPVWIFRPSMLEIAKKKVPGGSFYQGDMSAFELDERFDVILSMFDAVNHLTDYNDWKNLFRLANDHLVPGGVFIFDINTPGRLEQIAVNPPLVLDLDGRDFMTMKLTEKSKADYDFLIRVFTEKESHLYREEVEIIHETVVKSSLVKHDLEAIFETVEAYDAGHRPVRNEYEWEAAYATRLFWVCGKRMDRS